MHRASRAITGALGGRSTDPRPPHSAAPHAAVRRAAFETLESRHLFAQSIWAYPGADGKLLYKPLPLGDKIGDYSNVGYMGGTAAIPDVPVKVAISPVDGDDTASIQSAIDAVEAMPLDANGFRGAVLLNPGVYEIATSVTINTSGVILRGSGQGQTTLLATGTEKDTVVRLDGSGSRSTVAGTTKTITDEYVPLGAISFTVNNTTGLAVGDTLIVQRPTTANWIEDIGMDRLTNPWTSRNVDMDRTITRIDGNVITIDAPTTHALDQNYGGGTIWKYTATGRLANVGVEYISGESTFDPTLLNGSDRIDENHAEHFIGVDGVINGWVRNVTSKYFGYSCVNMTGPSKWVTVQDGQCLDPVSVVTGGRRYSFNMGDSTNVLWKNLYTRHGRHDYVQGSEVTGPNVVVDSRADNARADTGPHHRYSTGTLWDNLDVNGNAINIQNRWNSGSGHGWAGANQVVWNSEANSFIIQNIGQPNVSAWNWAIGNIGTVDNGNLTNGGAPVGTQGFYDSHGTKVDTRSLFHAQMAEKLAHETWMLREVRIGDADNYLAGDAADAVPVDAAWKTAVQNASGRTGVGFDAVANNQLVPATFNFALDPGTYVVGATLSLGLKSAGNNTNGDTIYFENAGRRYTWAELGVAAPGLTGDATVIDLSRLLAVLQDGKLNLAVSGNTAIDWATLNLQTASIAQPTTTSLTPTDDSYVDQANPASNFGGNTSLFAKLNGATDNRDSFLKFDLASLGGNVINAYVRLVPTGVGVNATTFGSGIGAMFTRISFVADDAWTEGAVNWNTKPASDAFFGEFISYPNEPLTFDVTALVRAAQAGDKKLSLRLNSAVNDDNSQVTFASSENANVVFRPQLVIESVNAVNPVADAYVRGGVSAGLNFGGATDLAVKNDSAASQDNDREAFLRFDLNGLGAAPAGASLWLMPFAVPAVMQHAAALVDNDLWSETGITWNNSRAFPTGPALGSWRPAVGAWSVANVSSAAAAAFASDKLLSLKVTSGTASTAAHVQYASRDSADALLRPMLVSTNLKPAITAVPDLAGSAGAPSAAQWFGVWDAETPAAALTVSATSSNTALLPSGNITFGGSGMDRTFTLSPAAGQSGMTTVTLSVIDAQGQTTSTTFQFSVDNTVAINGDQDAPNQDDVFRIVRNGAFLDLFRNDMLTPVVHVDYATAPRFLINALGGADQVRLDLSGGNPIPAAGLMIDTGADDDTVDVLGGAGADAVTLTAAGVTVGSSVAEVAPGSAEAMYLALGAGADTLTSGGTLPVPGGVLLDVTGGGSLTMTAGSALPTFTDVNVAAGTTFNLNGQSLTFDALTGSGAVTSTAVATLTVGQENGSGTFGGSITGAIALTKTGGGTLTLTGINSYSGVSTIGGGVLESGNAASFAALAGQVRFNGGTFRVTANTTAINFNNKFTTSFAGATAASTGTFDVAAGVTLTIGGASPSLQTNGGGAHGGRFTKMGAGTLRIVGGNNQLDDPTNLNQGTIIAEHADALGRADAGVRLDMKSNATLVLRQNTATNFQTPIHALDAGGTINVVIDRIDPGAGVAHALNALTSAGAFTLNVSAGPNVTGGVVGFTLGTMTPGGAATFNVVNGVLASTAVTVSGVIGGAFAFTKSGAGSLVLGSSFTSSPLLSVAGGRFALLPGQDTVIWTTTLSITGGGTIDLADNRLITASAIGTWTGAAYNGVSGHVDAGRGPAGAWNGSGMVTSMPAAVTGLTALGAANAADALNIPATATATWGGQIVNGFETLVMYTFGGDANLDGTINVDDYGRIDSNVSKSGSVFGWSSGDFNYDGVINVDDYGIIDSNVGQQGDPFTNSGVAASAATASRTTDSTPSAPAAHVAATPLQPVRSAAPAALVFAWFPRDDSEKMKELITARAAVVDEVAAAPVIKPVRRDSPRAR